MPQKIIIDTDPAWMTALPFRLRSDHLNWKWLA